MGIQFVNFNVPLERRLQTMAVTIYALIIPTGIGLGLLACSFIKLWPLVLLYIIYMFFDERKRSERVRRSTFWKYFSNYFPIKLVKTVDLNPKDKYIFGYHPHGIIGMGAVCNFATEATEFSEKFPGITCSLLTLSSNFYMPLQRDLITKLGIQEVSGESAKRILKTGESIAIVVGGAEEALNARPGTHDLILRRRIGFIKLAIRQGANLVPVYSFGENEIFEQFSNSKGTLLHTLQTYCRQLFGFTLPAFYGRGIFNYNFGVLPFRKPITSVVGQPIIVTQCDNPTAEMMETVRLAYEIELIRIFDEYKGLYGDEKAVLNFLS